MWAASEVNGVGTEHWIRLNLDCVYVRDLSKLKQQQRYSMWRIWQECSNFLPGTHSSELKLRQRRRLDDHKKHMQNTFHHILVFLTFHHSLLPPPATHHMLCRHIIQQKKRRCIYTISTAHKQQLASMYDVRGKNWKNFNTRRYFMRLMTMAWKTHFLPATH